MTKKRKSKQRRGDVDLVVNFGDTHTNSTRGLRPPRFYDREKEEWRHIPQTVERHLWEPWCQQWKDVKAEKKRLKRAGYNARVIAVFNGDGPDRNYHDREGFEMITPHEAVILELCEEMLQPALAPGLVDRWVFTRGTRAHEGGGGKLAEQLAQRVDKEYHADVWRPDNQSTWSHYDAMLDIQGVPIQFTHHPPTKGNLAHTRRQGAARAATHYWSLANMPVIHFNKVTYERRPFPLLVICNHVHHYADSGGDATNPIRVVFSPSWQLPTSYIHRIGRGTVPNEVGAVWVKCHDGEYDLMPWLHTPPPMGAVRV